MEFKLFIDLTMDPENDVAMVKMFLNLVDTQGRDTYETMTFKRLPNERTLKHVLDALEEHCNPKKNETVERYMCNMRNQYQEETFDKYVTEIQLLGSTCNYGTLHNSIIRDGIVCGINNSSLRERLLRTADLTLEKTCNWEEQQSSQKKELRH